MSVTITPDELIFTADEKCRFCKNKYLFMEQHKKKCIENRWGEVK